MTPNQVDRVWLLPQKFCSATKEMPAEEVDSLMELVMGFSAARDFESRQKFDFIVVGETRKMPRNCSRKHRALPPADLCAWNFRYVALAC